MLAKIREEQQKEEGFTLIELLVVVIIIGILAAIAIPAFLNQREGAWRKAAESDARNAAIQLETYFTEASAYPVDGTWDNAGSPHTLGTTTQTVVVSPGVTLAFDNLDNGTYTITATHANLTGQQIVYNSATGGLGSWAAGS